jgi:hypothetical protein
MKRKSRTRKQKRNLRKTKKSQVRSTRQRTSKRRPRSTFKRRLVIPKTEHQTSTHRKSLATLARVRRGESLTAAARQEHIKPKTVQRHVGRALYRSGPNKPWKATKTDRLSAKMLILTERGPIFDVARSSIERTRLSRYDVALRKWRAGEDGAEQELAVFTGQMVAGHLLITNPDLLIRLEEAGQLDFDNLYYSVGGGS